MGFMWYVGSNGSGSFFQASLLGTQPAPFDGTVYPVKETINWVKLSGSEYTSFKKGTFDYAAAKAAGKLIDIPTYDKNVLKNDPSSLSWSGGDLDIRNTILTYVTAYMGAYTGGSEAAIEYAGSHLAVDIRGAKGTPIYAVANGKVVEIKDSSSDGKHIVIEHPNVPSVEDPSKKVTYYSSYLHLDTISVKEGDYVTKGDQIGTMGDTGIATTYHLHFQIDKSDAPFHPYWPFTWSDASAAGLDFFSGVNEGLGQDKAIAYTINPFDWVNKYMNYSATTDSENTNSTISNANTNAAPTVDNAVSTLVMTSDKTSMTTGETATMSLSALDSSNGPVSDYSTPVTLTLNPGAKGTLSQSELTTFNNGTATFSYTSDAAEDVTITASNGTQATSIDLSVRDTTTSSTSVSKLTLDYDTTLAVGQSMPVHIKTLDSSGALISGNLTDNITLSIDGGEGELSSTALTGSDFTDGVATVTFSATRSGTIAIVARSGTISGTGPILTITGASTASANGTGGATFSDVPEGSDHYDAITYLKAKGIINGYDDGTFKPDQEVNRAEILKIILGGSNIDATTDLTSFPFPDVSSDQWFAGWVAAAKERGIVSGNPDGTFVPDETVTKAAAMKILLLTNQVDLSNFVLTEKPYEDVEMSDWFALYFEYAKEKNLIEGDSNGNIIPAAGMTRGEVAEMMYRLIRLQETGSSRYSSALDI